MVNSQELKNKILRNLTDWCFDPLGNLVDAKALMGRIYEDENSYWFRYLKDDESNPNWRTEPKTTSAELTSEDYQEVKEAMTNEIRCNPQDWKIEREGDLTVIKHKTGRKHWKSDFSEGFKKGFKEKEWKEIEDTLNSQEKVPLSLVKEQEQQGNYNNWTKEQLISEINRLKSRIAELEGSQILTTSEKQSEIKQNQQKSEQIQSFLSLKDTQQLTNTNNNSLTSLLVGGALLAVVCLVSFLFIKKHKKKERLKGKVQ